MAGRKYGIKVIDPDTESEIFNSKYPTFGFDLTAKKPHILTHRITITNSSGYFGEPGLPRYDTYPDGNWRDISYPIMDKVFMASVHHGLGYRPSFYVTGDAEVVARARARYWHNEGGNIRYNEVHTPEDDNQRHVYMPSRLGGVPGLVAPPAGTSPAQFFNNMGPIRGKFQPPYPDSWFSIEADEHNINIYASLYGTLSHHEVREFWGGFDRYIKYWWDITGSWYQFTFYILPYNENNEIFIQ